MTRHAWKAAAALLAGVIALCGWRTAGAVRALAHASTSGERTGLGTPAERRLSLEAGHALRGIAAPGLAVVFVYSPDCAVCHANMGNWIDIVAHPAAGPVRFHAAAPERTAAARGYWGALAASVEIILSDTVTLMRALGVEGTPATLLVRDGVVRRRYAGALTPAGKREVMDFVARGALPPDRT